MARDFNAELKDDVEGVNEYPPFQEVAHQCIKQMCRAGVIDDISRYPGVSAMDIDAVASCMNESAKLISHLMVLLAKAYRDKGLPIVVEDIVKETQDTERERFGLAEMEEEWPSKPSEPNPKLN